MTVCEGLKVVMTGAELKEQCVQHLTITQQELATAQKWNRDDHAAVLSQRIRFLEALIKYTKDVQDFHLTNQDLLTIGLNRL